MTSRIATCSCGQLRATTTGEPLRVSICHCLECQRRTGSAFGAQARFRSDQVSVTGTCREYARIADSGQRIRFHFCPDCGSTVTYALEALPDMTVVALGAFADPSFPAPTYSVYESRRHAWAGLPDAIEHID